MSFFYASPVGGEMHLHDLEKAVKDRVEFLKALIMGHDLKYSEFLLEGSAYDNAGHFALYIVQSLSRNSDLSNLVRTGELKLFDRRISFLKSHALQTFAKKLLRYIKNKVIHDRYAAALQELCSILAITNIANHITCNHSALCKQHSISVHFSLCLSFVSTRIVEIKAGQAIIHCGLWMKYMTALYKMHLCARDQLRDHLEVFRNDDRIMSIAAHYNTYGKGQGPDATCGEDILLSKDIDLKSKYFPPCMKNLHSKFREHHRLSHDQRFYYTCFLKDIGMPVSEAIKFWKEEYSKNSCSKVCQHSWAADGAKYVRSIRHTYGLEGSRTSYSCAGCTKIQGTSGERGEGGCPFKNFNAGGLEKALNVQFTSNSESMKKLHTFCQRGHYSKACSYYLKTLFPSKDIDMENAEAKSLFLSPIKYYMYATN